MELNTAMVGGAPAELLDPPAPGRLIVTPHPVLLEGQRNVPADLQPGESLESFLERHLDGIGSGAWSVSIGGYEVPRALWSRTWPKHGQVIACRASVQKSALKLVAIAALVYFTGGIALAGGAMAFGGSMLSVGLVVAGAAIINKVLTPKVPKAGSGTAKEVYSLSDQRNSARQNEPIGVLLGEMRVTPDLASNQYTWFQSDDQYLASTLLGGINVASYSDLSVGDTPLSNYSDVTVYTNGFSGMPSVPVPLYSNADTIEGALLEDTQEWVTRTSSVDSLQLQIDLEYSLYKSGEGLSLAFLIVEAQYRAVGTSSWLPFGRGTSGTPGNYSYSNKSTELRRTTLTQVVDPGQYEVRMRRVNGINDSNTTRTAQWTYLRSIQPDSTDYSDWGRIGIKIKATGQLNGTLDTVRATFHPRPLPVWNGTAWINATTRAEGISNPGALILLVLRGVRDAAGNLQFGMGMSDDQIGLDGLKGFMLHCAANGYTYDRWITEAISLNDLLEEIALAGMGQFMWLNGSSPTVMWAANGQPLGGVVNMANMTRGSFQVSYTLTNAADGIEYQYQDRDKDFETVTLRVTAPGVTTMLNPARITGVGVTTEAHAAVLARYHLGQSLYQFKDISFGADIEHLDYRRMSMLSLSHDMTQWAHGGRLVSASLVGGVISLELDQPVPALPSRFVGLRVPGEVDYRVFGVQAFTGTSDVLTLTGSWPDGVAFPGDTSGNPAHDTLWCYDVKATPGYRVRVVQIEPEPDLKGATVRVVPESDEFWTYVLTGAYQPAPVQPANPQLDPPVVSNIRVTSQTNTQGNTEWVQLNVAWDCSGEVEHCQVWGTIDGQEQRLQDGAAVGNRTSFRIDTNGSWLIKVVPFDSKGRAGASASVLFLTDALDAPPWNVDQFALDDLVAGIRRFRFGYSESKPPAYAGVQIRYRAGLTPVSVDDWADMTPLGAASDIYTGAVETTRPPAGAWTFACRAITTAGVLAEGVAQLSRTLTEAFSDIIAEDPTPPPTPQNVEVAAGFSKLIITHDTPTYTAGHGHKKTKVYGKVMAAGDPLPVFADASPLHEFTGPITSYPAPLGTTLRLWLTWVTNDDVESLVPAGGDNGIAVTTGKIGGQDLAPLAVTAAALAADAVNLGSDKVTGTITDPARFGALAVGYTVTQYLLATEGYMAALYVDNAQISSLSADKILAGALAVGRYLRSTNYVANNSGWNIGADGSAEFSNVHIRGTSTFDGQVTMRNPNGSIAFQSGVVNLDSSLVNPSNGWLNSSNASSANLIPNSDQTSSVTMAYGNTVAGSIDVGLQYASNFWPDTYTLHGTGTRNLTIHQATNNGTGDNGVGADIYPLGAWDLAHSVPVLAGQRYCMSVYFQAHRCCGGVGIQFFAVDGSFISEAYSGATLPAWPAITNADDINAYKRPFVLASAPSNAVYMRPYVRKHNTLSGQGLTDSWFWLAAPQLEAVGATATGPGAYSPGPSLIAGRLTEAVVATYMDAAVIDAAHIKRLSATLISTGINGGTASGIQIAQNLLSIFTDTNAQIIDLGKLA